MRGRMGLAMVLAAGLLVCGCAHQTPEQKQAQKLQKQQASQAKADAKQAERNARLARKQADADARAAKAQAAEQAKLDATNAETARRQAAADQKRAAARIKAEQQRAMAQARREQREQALADARWRAEVAKATPQPQDPIDFESQQFPDIYPDDTRNVIGYPEMTPENNPRLLDAHVKAVAAQGARQDGMLFNQHFDGANLSALGRSKVSLMLHAAPKDQPLRIYVALSGSEEQGTARVATVENYWKGSRYAAVPVEIKQGMNPDAMAPAVLGLSALQKLDKGDGTPQTATAGGGDTTGGRSRTGGSGSGSSSGSSGR